MSEIKPPVVLENLEILNKLDEANVAKLINLRAGRVPESEVSADAIINQFNLIESELLEGKLAASIGDLDSVRDAIADITLLALGQQGIIAGLDLAADYRLMCAYNMTRIPKSQEEAERTVIKYKTLGIETAIHELELNIPEMGVNEKVFAVRCINEDQWDVRGEHYPPNKFVKSVEFLEPKYDEVKNVSIVKAKTDKDKIGTLFTKEMSRKLINQITENHGTHGTVPVKDLINFLADTVGKRF